MERLYKIINKRVKHGVGLISGTSSDGVDAAVISLNGSGTERQMELLHFESHPYPDGIKEKILDFSACKQIDFDQFCRLDFLLGEIFAEAALNAIQSAGLTAQEIDFIGCHGQTVRHLPNPEQQFGFSVTATRQIAEPAVIARRTGIVTVADFRPADMAAGGQGAPLVPFFDFVCFRSDNKSRILLNIGGIANMTVIPKKARLQDVAAFDTGPGNMIIDYLMQKLFSKPYDADGRLASSGAISQDLLEYGLRHPYFKRPPPKSTGREEFGTGFSENLLSQARELSLKPEHTIATATALTARTIVDAYKVFIAVDTPADEMIVSGGGAHNRFLIDEIKKAAGEVDISKTDDYGVPADAKEAMCFALLAYETLHGNPSNLMKATGATAPAVLGKICL